MHKRPIECRGRQHMPLTHCDIARTATYTQIDLFAVFGDSAKVALSLRRDAREGPNDFYTLELIAILVVYRRLRES